MISESFSPENTQLSEIRELAEPGVRIGAG
jgi:hypothetical protein